MISPKRMRLRRWQQVASRVRLLIGLRRLVLLGLGLSACWAYLYLDLRLRDVVLSTSGLSLAREFFLQALSPAIRPEADLLIPVEEAPILVNVLNGIWTTIIIAAASIGLSCPIGFCLGMCCSRLWWFDRPFYSSVLVRLIIAPIGYGSLRSVVAVARAVHELIWAVLFLAAFGITYLTVVVAIAIPYTGTFAKVFSELIDETQRDSAIALQAIGASSAQAFVVGVLPRASADLIAYTFYRFECALRSSAVIGFLGFPTLGYYIAASFENLYFGEVWTYLFCLFGLVIVMDWWSGTVRKRLLA
jgi:phosphonate transport system permease protein